MFMSYQRTMINLILWFSKDNNWKCFFTHGSKTCRSLLQVKGEVVLWDCTLEYEYKMMFENWNGVSVVLLCSITPEWRFIHQIEFCVSWFTYLAFSSRTLLALKHVDKHIVHQRCSMASLFASMVVIKWRGNSSAGLTEGFSLRWYHTGCLFAQLRRETSWTNTSTDLALFIWQSTNVKHKLSQLTNLSSVYMWIWTFYYV